MRTYTVAILAGIALGALVIVCLESRLPVFAERSARPCAADRPAPEIEILRQRSEAKARLARRFAIDRTPLLEAAALFREANGVGGMELLVLGVPGATLQEKLCRQAIEYVRRAETELVGEGNYVPEPLWSLALQADLDRRLADGGFPPEADVY